MKLPTFQDAEKEKTYYKNLAKVTRLMKFATDQIEVTNDAEFRMDINHAIEECSANNREGEPA